MSRRPSRAGAWALLLVGVAALLAAWWLTNRPTPESSADGSVSAPTRSASVATSAPDGPVPPEAQPAVARWVIDGDTIDVEIEDSTRGEGAQPAAGASTTAPVPATHRLRLANIDAPEIGHPDQPAQCRGEAAKSALIALAPRGTALRIVLLGRDVHGRDVGEAWLPDGRMLGAEIARAGLAAPMTVGDLDTYRPVIDTARDEAATARRGLHDPTISCTLPAKVSALESRLHGIRGSDGPAATGGETEDATQVATQAAAIDAEAATLLADLTHLFPRPGVAALTDATRADLVARVRAIAQAAQQLRSGA